MDGKVECDASLMDGRLELFGAVGALSGRKVHYLIIFKLMGLLVYLQVSRTLLPLPASFWSEESCEDPWVVFPPCWNALLIILFPSYWHS